MYAVSWLVNFLIIAIIVAIVDDSMYREIEKHQTLGALFIFMIPTALEVASHFLTDKPFLMNL